MLKQTLVVSLAALALTACASNPNKAEPIATQMNHVETISGDLKLGIKNGDMIVQHKVQIAEHLRDLQIQVYELEDNVYGNEQYGSMGLYGVLKDCRMKVSDKSNGGNGQLTWIEPLDRVTDKEADMKIGLDEQDKLVGISEEFLKDRIIRFRGYRTTLEGRKAELQTKLDVCKVQLQSNTFDVKASQPTAQKEAQNDQ